jgi:glycosyltransferase involved in cell wall biosynthesis
MEPSATGTQQKVAVVYQCFAHYRAAVLEALAEVDDLDVEFYADTKNVEAKGVPPWEPSPGLHRFHKTLTHKLPFGFMWQEKIICLAFRRDLDTVIFLGSSYYLATWVSAALCRIFGKRVLFWTIGWRRLDGPLKSLFRTRFYRLAHGLLLYGYFAKSEAIRRGFRPESLHVIFNSLDYEQQVELRQEVTAEHRQAQRRQMFPATYSQPILICTSRLVRKRQLDDLLRVVGKLREAGHLFNVLLVGDGEERVKLETMARELNLVVHFYGACYDEKVVAKLIMASDVTVAPGMVGLTAMQSLAYGTPVITHDNPYAQAPEFESILPGVNGGLFKHDDLDSLADVIQQWTRAPKTPEVERSCYRMIERFYNPAVQAHLIRTAIRRIPANDVELAVWTQTRLDHQRSPGDATTTSAPDLAENT